MSYAIATRCHFMTKWKTKHIAAAKHIVGYLKGTKTLALTFKQDTFICLHDGLHLQEFI